jgi:dTDP-4-dehydrorhamnose reductase
VNATRRILLTGGSGQVGWELRRALAPLGEVVAPPRADLDLKNTTALREAVRALRPAAVVNCAAYTDVERAEGDLEAARALNAEAPAALAEAVARAGGLMVHFSTDFVFDGAKRAPYSEDDAASPLNIYGRTKHEGELGVAAAGGAHLVLRTSWIYGVRGRNFFRTMRTLAMEREVLTVVDDQKGAPTWSRMVAEATALALGQLAAGDGFASDGPWGTYHVTAAGSTTWHGFAEALLAGDPHRAAHRCRRVEPVSSEAFGTRARRPPQSVLDSRRFARVFGVRLPHWSSQLQMVLDEL